MHRFQDDKRAADRYATWLLGMMAVLVVTGVLCWVGARACASEAKNLPPEHLVNDLAAQLSQDKIDRIEVYYFNWAADTSSALTEEDLLQQADYRIVASRPWGEKDLLNALKTFRPKKYEGIFATPLDVRLGCLFYSKDGKEAFRLFFRRSSPVVWVCGTPCRPSAELLDAMAQFVPCRAQEEIRRTIFSLWIHANEAH